MFRCLLVCVCSWQANATLQCQIMWALPAQSHYPSVHVRETLNSLPSVSHSLKLYRRILPIINERGVQLKWASVQAPGASH